MTLAGWLPSISGGQCPLERLYRGFGCQPIGHQPCLPQQLRKVIQNDLKLSTGLSASDCEKLAFLGMLNNRCSSGLCHCVPQSWDEIGSGGKFNSRQQAVWWKAQEVIQIEAC